MCLPALGAALLPQLGFAVRVSRPPASYHLILAFILPYRPSGSSRHLILSHYSIGNLRSHTGLSSSHTGLLPSHAVSIASHTYPLCSYLCLLRCTLSYWSLIRSHWSVRLSGCPYLGLPGFDTWPFSSSWPLNLHSPWCCPHPVRAVSSLSFIVTLDCAIFSLWVEL